MRSKVLQAMDIFADERHFRLRLFFEGLLIGALTGTLIAVFRYLLEGSEDLRRLAYHWLRTAEPGWFLLYGAAFLLAAFLLAAIVRREPLSSGSGIPQIKGILLGKMHMHWASVLLYKFLGGVLAIGMGLSLGREGPSVQLGASIGQGVSRGRKRSRAEERFLLTAGSGAGLAAAFNAPLAGVMFCLEELQKNFSPLVLMATIAATVAATAVTQLAFGVQPVFHMGELAVMPMGMYGLLILLGAFVGLLGMGFNRMLLFSLDSYNASPLHGWQRPLVPLAAAAVLGFVLPEILGGGNRLVDTLVTEHYSVLFLLLLFAGKFLFTMLCFGSGVPGGIFLPMLVLGALGGALFSQLALFLHLMEPAYATNLIVFGMAAYFAAVVKSPVTGSVLIMEMTGSFQHMLALICVSMAAYLVTDMAGGEPVYDALLDRSLRLRERIRKAVRRRRVVAEFVLGPGCRLEGVCIQEAPWPPHCLLVNIRRGEADITPKGGLRLEAGDYIYILTDDTDIAALQVLTTERFTS